MGKHKSLILRCLIDKAKKSHSCKFNKSHKIATNEKRLKIILQDGRSTEIHYCKECAVSMLDIAISELTKRKFEILKD